MSASSAIDQALIAMLGSDPTLLSYLPHGVYWAGDTPEWATTFVEVSLVTEDDAWVFGQRAIEDALYLVEAKMRSTAGTKAAIVAAEARIDALLDGHVLGLGAPPTVAGYICMDMALEVRVSETQRDDRDASIVWWHRGGYYRVRMSMT